ncbi:MAG: urease accessory UreF family protein [Actinomycetota bacterium]|nr:urease accessory UreF family protein [Actinomycetota bacterium]
MSGRAELLLVADGRFPSGGHAHSFGMEAAVRELGVTDVAGVRRFIRARLTTIGATEAAVTAHVVAALAAAAADDGAVPDWPVLDAEVTARLASPATREASRELGRQLVRVGTRVWPDAGVDRIVVDGTTGPHQAVAWGAVGHAAGLDPHEVAAVAVHHLATAMATAAVRLLGLDPFEVQAVLQRDAAVLDEVAARAAAAASLPCGELPAVTSPLADLLAEQHAHYDGRLFRS